MKFVVYFDFDKSELSPAAHSVLAEARSAAQKLGGVVKIDGTADRSGSEDYNRTLSELRVGAVTKYLAASGVPETAFKTRAFGEYYTAKWTDDEVREPANRRVEITVERK